MSERAIVKQTTRGKKAGVAQDATLTELDFHRLSQVPFSDINKGPLFFKLTYFHRLSKFELAKLLISNIFAHARALPSQRYLLSRTSNSLRNGVLINDPGGDERRNTDLTIFPFVSSPKTFSPLHMTYRLPKLRSLPCCFST